MIKTLLFDFGDVFINLDKAAVLRELERREVKDFESGLLELNRSYETGKLSSQEFVQAIRREYSHLSESDVTSSWNSILLDFPRHRLEFLKKLKADQHYQLILLSNTNDLHIDFVKENVAFFEEFKNCFDAFYLSQEINMRKPEPSIYQYVLKQHELRPEEVLFIDDTRENTEAASALGIHTWNIKPGEEDVTELFSVKKELF